jgi:cytidylate kinase
MIACPPDADRMATASGVPIDLVTVSREYGSGGSDLARLLGERLHWPVLDRNLAQKVADRLRLEPHHVEALDEQTPSLLARFVSSALMMTPPELHLEIEIREVLHPDVVAEAARAAILTAAQSPPLIVVGHGAQCLFRDRPGTLHVRLVAPLAQRVRRVCGRMPCDPERAIAEARRMDQGRASYVRRHYHCDWRDSLLYDVQFNTGRIPIEEAAAAVAELVASGSRQPAAAPGSPAVAV